MTRGEQRLMRERNARLESELHETQQQLEDLRLALLDAKKATAVRGEINAEMLHTIRGLSRFDAGQFAAVNGCEVE